MFTLVFTLVFTLKTIENKGFFNKVNRVNSIFYKTLKKYRKGNYRENSVRVFTLDRKALEILDFWVNRGCSAVRGRPDRPPAPAPGWNVILELREAIRTHNIAKRKILW